MNNWTACREMLCQERKTRHELNWTELLRTWTDVYWCLLRARPGEQVPMATGQRNLEQSIYHAGGMQWRGGAPVFHVLHPMTQMRLNSWQCQWFTWTSPHSKLEQQIKKQKKKMYCLREVNVRVKRNKATHGHALTAWQLGPPAGPASRQRPQCSPIFDLKAS
jgi:hypothetical protein